MQKINSQAKSAIGKYNLLLLLNRIISNQFGLAIDSLCDGWVYVQNPNSQMSLEHPYGVSLSSKNLLPPPQSTSFLPLPKEDTHSNNLFISCRFSIELIGQIYNEYWPILNHYQMKKI